MSEHTAEYEVGGVAVPIENPQRGKTHGNTMLLKTTRS
jgi:hypothetical protein